MGNKKGTFNINTKMFPLTIAIFTSVLGPAVGLDTFLNCPDNQPNLLERIFDDDRRCCESKELPNDCECFSTKGYTYPVLPKCPEDLGVRFLLYNKDNLDVETPIQALDSSIDNSQFQNGKPVIFVIHGYGGKAPSGWTSPLKDAFLQNDQTKDVNVILVDWRHGATVDLPNLYTQAKANMRTVGAMVATLVTQVVDRQGVDYPDIHLIGHSLGAHVAAIAAKEVYRLTNRKVGRISGLDPGGPPSVFSKSRTRLMEDDAEFVDVVHTNAGGFGIGYDTGSVDFWVNGGKSQPQCKKDSLDNILKSPICSHLLAWTYYTNSINACRYETGGGCRMGYFATKEACTKRSISISTASSPPYCKTMLFLQSM